MTTAALRIDPVPVALDELRRRAGIRAEQVPPGYGRVVSPVAAAHVIPSYSDLAVRPVRGGGGRLLEWVEHDPTGTFPAEPCGIYSFPGDRRPLVADYDGGLLRCSRCDYALIPPETTDTNRLRIDSDPFWGDWADEPGFLRPRPAEGNG